MEGTNVITEKYYCHDYPYGGYDRGGHNDAAWIMMANNQWNNNPFIYFMLPAMMRMMYGDNWNDRTRGDYAEINARFNQLQGQISDNHNTDILNEAVKGNSARLGELAANLNVDMRTLQTGICDLRAGLQNVDGDVKFTGERVINANLMGVKDMQSTFKDCCCENRLAQKDTIIAFNERMNGIANGITKGFSDIGYLMAQNKGDTINAINAAQQRTADLLNNHWKEELAKALQDQKFENSQLRQNIYMRDLYEKGNGCGCGVA